MYKAKFYLCKSAKFAYLRKDLRDVNDIRNNLLVRETLCVNR